MSQLDRRIRGSLLGGCFALAALVTLAWAPHDDDAELLPEQILFRMHDVYAACDSYSDTGKVRTVFHSERGERVDVKPFATAFRRPDRFRFEYLDAREWLGDTTWSHYVIWQGGDEVRTQWDVTPHADPPPSLQHALVAATGVSSRAALTVPQMLLPDLITSNSFLGLALLQRLPDAAIGDVDCFRVRGSSQRSPTTLWISKDALLLRRIETERHFDTFRTVTTTDYDPVLNVELSDAELAFDASPFPR